MRYIILGTIVALGAAVGFVCHLASDNPPALASILSAAPVDVVEGEVVKMHVDLRNTARRGIEIRGCRASCACTATLLPSSAPLRVGPSDKLGIDIGINTQGRAGRSNKFLLEVDYEDQGILRSLPIEICLDIRPSLRISPPSISVLDAVSGKKEVFSFDVYDGLPDDPRPVLRVTASCPDKMATHLESMDGSVLESAQGRIRRRHRLIVEYTPAEIPTVQAESIELALSDDRVRPLSVPIVCKLKASQYVFSPSKLVVARTSGATKVSREIRCVNNGGGKWRATVVECPSFIEITQHDVDIREKAFVLTIDLSAKRVERTVIRLCLVDSQACEIAFPVTVDGAQ